METVISDYGMNGEGVAFIEGKTTFVPYSLIGEAVDVTIDEDFSNYAVARVEKINTQSNERVCPPCP